MGFLPDPKKVQFVVHHFEYYDLKSGLVKPSFSHSVQDSDRVSIFSAFTRPFQILFKTDANEATASTGALGATMAQLNEQSGVPGGIVGFQLNFNQVLYT